MLNNRMLTIAVVVLLLLNAGTLGYLLLGPAAGPRGPVHRMVEKELHLTQAQVETYTKMHQSHHKAMDSLNRQYAQTLERYFAQIGQSAVNTQVADSIEASLSAITTRKARITLDHFVAFKAILTPEQATKFLALLPEVMHVMQPQRPNGPPARK